ncbi:sugar phosphate isomerase/epimerase family protein [Lentilactobacillus buchneri]|mgnify:CR=1 FL=1|uniref:sugar phosphate isomerase/epimerase family protein n=1 Tax=Lentilactobacillus buchneri TaxID=1581 RepID=UPI0021A4AC94|nr:sugar phosphate isomerase/epimerase [Lentilactobacillus buchneri]
MSKKLNGKPNLSIFGGVNLNHYVLNTIAFKNWLDDGASQADLVLKTKNLGFNFVEIRNEFLDGNSAELAKIKASADSAGIGVYYSVNDPLIKDGKVNTDIDRYISEMKVLGSSHLKMNIGNMDNISSSFADDLKEKISTNSELEFNVENNQTLEESKLENIVAFFKLVDKSKLPIGFCFDTANWYWTESEPNKAAEQLASVTKYLHLKNKSGTGNSKSVTSLDKGEIDIKPLISKFNVNEYGFEYAAPFVEIEHDLNEIKTLN